ncbi:hypothetical protein DFJ73DRAFT_811500 [Zopfochytrium polystomum]|nr:hypothetical protein DFJ73DRAFT_811500 [Zopfochytrium polystomum]
MADTHEQSKAEEEVGDRAPPSLGGSQCEGSATPGGNTPESFASYFVEASKIRPVHPRGRFDGIKQARPIDPRSKIKETLTTAVEGPLKITDEDRDRQKTKINDLFKRVRPKDPPDKIREAVEKLEDQIFKQSNNKLLYDAKFKKALDAIEAKLEAPQQLLDDVRKRQRDLLTKALTWFHVDRKRICPDNLCAPINSLTLLEATRRHLDTSHGGFPWKICLNSWQDGPVAVSKFADADSAGPVVDLRAIVRISRRRVGSSNFEALTCFLRNPQGSGNCEADILACHHSGAYWSFGACPFCPPGDTKQKSANRKARTGDMAEHLWEKHPEEVKKALQYLCPGDLIDRAFRKGKDGDNKFLLQSDDHTTRSASWAQAVKSAPAKLESKDSGSGSSNFSSKDSGYSSSHSSTQKLDEYMKKRIAMTPDDSILETIINTTRKSPTVASHAAAGPYQQLPLVSLSSASCSPSSSSCSGLPHQMHSHHSQQSTTAVMPILHFPGSGELVDIERTIAFAAGVIRCRFGTLQELENNQILVNVIDKTGGKSDAEESGVLIVVPAQLSDIKLSIPDVTKLENVDIGPQSDGLRFAMREFNKRGSILLKVKYGPSRKVRILYKPPAAPERDGRAHFGVIADSGEDGGDGRVIEIGEGRGGGDAADQNSKVAQKRARDDGHAEDDGSTEDYGSAEALSQKRQRVGDTVSAAQQYSAATAPSGADGKTDADAASAAKAISEKSHGGWGFVGPDMHQYSTTPPMPVADGKSDDDDAATPPDMYQGSMTTAMPVSDGKLEDDDAATPPLGN